MADLRPGKRHEDVRTPPQESLQVELGDLDMIPASRPDPIHGDVQQQNSVFQNAERNPILVSV